MTTRILLIPILISVYTTSVWSTEITGAIKYIVPASRTDDFVVDLPSLKRALQNGADPNWVVQQAIDRESTLSIFLRMWGRSRNSSTSDETCIKAIKMLIAAGAKLQPEDRGILLWPVLNGNTNLVAILLDLGADATKWPTSTDIPDTPVETAAERGHLAMVDLLVSRGATRPDETPDLTQQRFVQAALNSSLDSLDALLKKGANVNVPGEDGDTALVNAIQSGLGCDSISKVRYLLKAGADPNSLSKSRSTFSSSWLSPIKAAVYGTIIKTRKEEDLACNETLISMLIDSGAYVSSLDDNKQSPLHLAARLNSLSAAKLLLKAGAKVMPRDKTGQTPLDLAESGAMIRLLKSYGATEH